MLRPPYRSGPWPGLTASGAAVLLLCALLTAWLVEAVKLDGFAALVPLVLATLIVRAPGAASAVVGAYLLPRTLWSLLEPANPLPPQLLVPAIAFDIAAWLRPNDLRAVADAWPRKRARWRKRDRSPRRLTPLRVVLAAITFALVFAVMQPAWQSFAAR